MLPLVLSCILAPLPLSAQGAGEPQVTPVSVQPELKNPDQARRVLEVVHPATLKAAGIEGVVNLWLHVDAMGRVTETRLKESSGFVAYDDAAAEVARAMTFTPAERDGAAVPAWITMNVRFPGAAEDATAPAAASPATRPAAAPAPSSAAAAATEEDISAGPTFTPMTVRPRIINIPEVQAALIELYPPVLRDAGIGGSVNVWFFIDETGAIRKTQVNETSGYDAFDQAALAVARRIRFTPAENDGTPVPVWVAMDINFEVTP